MIIEQSASQAFWLTLTFSLITLALATFIFAWSRNRVLIWQKHTYRRYKLSKKGRKSIRRDASMSPNQLKVRIGRKNKNNKKKKTKEDKLEALKQQTVAKQAGPIQRFPKEITATTTSPQVISKEVGPKQQVSTSKLVPPLKESTPTSKQSQLSASKLPVSLSKVSLTRKSVTSAASAASRDSGASS